MWLTALYLARDTYLVLNGFKVRYVTLPPPRTFKRYWDFSHPTAVVTPSMISKVMWHVNNSWAILINTIISPFKQRSIKYWGYWQLWWEKSQENLYFCMLENSSWVLELVSRFYPFFFCLYSFLLNVPMHRSSSHPNPICVEIHLSYLCMINVSCFVSFRPSQASLIYIHII